MTPALVGNILKAYVLSCRETPHGAAGWARCNVPVFAGRSRRARWSRVLGCNPWPSPCLEREVRRKDRSVLGPLSRSLTPIAFGAVGNMSLATFSQVTCAEVAPMVPLWAPCDLVPWCITFSEVMRVASGGTFVP